MNPITRGEMFMAAAAGEYDGELPEPKTRLEYYLKKIKEAVENGSYVAPEDIDAAIEAYLNSHDADIVTEQELSDALAGYYDKDTIDTALAGKQATLTAGDNITIATVNGVLTISATDTTYSDATQQTHGLMSAADKTKLDSITAAKIQAWDAAEQNVNADWTAESGDAQILHKPDLSIYALAANVTKSALGIDNVDNTSDADKPISTAAETALAGKVDKETGKSLMTSDEHTKLNGIEAGAQVNVQSDWEQNNSNADDFIKNKPENLVQDASYVHTDNNYTTGEKTKLDGIAAGAQVNVKPDWNAAAGTNAEILNKPTIPTVMAGAAANAAGTAGLVPAPAAGDNGKFLRGDGTWVNLTIDQVYPVGSIYMSVNSTNPSALFGGTWVQLKDKFLLGAGDSYSAGATGGEAAHLLTNDELPADMGSFSALNWNQSQAWDWNVTSGIVSTTIRTQDRTLPTGNTTGDTTYNFNGGNQAHNNMPPYLVVYMWKRTA